MSTKIVVTGATSAIGTAIVTELAKQEPDADWILQGNQHGSNQTVSVDFTQPEQLAAFIHQIKETDILINAVAVTRTGVLPHMSDQDIRQMLEVNIYALTRICAAVLPGMSVRRRGCIVNISSIAAIRGNRGQAVYAGSKGYMEAFSRALAAEYGNRGIRINTVAPGPIDAGSLKELAFYAPDKIKDSFSAVRLGTPEDVAYLTAFLCSHRASFINGKTFGVDGGFMRGI